MFNQKRFIGLVSLMATLSVYTGGFILAFLAASLFPRESAWSVFVMIGILWGLWCWAFYSRMYDTVEGKLALKLGAVR